MKENLPGKLSHFLNKMFHDVFFYDFSAQPIFPGQPPPLARINVQQQQQQQPPPRQSSQPPSRTEFREPYAQATSVIHQPQEAVVVRQQPSPQQQQVLVVQQQQQSPQYYNNPSPQAVSNSPQVLHHFLLWVKKKNTPFLLTHPILKFEKLCPGKTHFFPCL